jgi:hypothetical protein
LNTHRGLPGRNFTLDYSEYWRRNKSSLESWELAHVLTALRKVGAYIAANIKPVEWADRPSSLPDLAKKSILVDIAMAMGEYPVPPGKMDRLVGLVARESYRCRELSDMVWSDLKPVADGMGAGHRRLLHDLADVGEDIYIRHAVDSRVWKNYLDKGWELCRPGKPRDFSLPPTAACLYRIWAEFSLTGRRAEDMHADYYRPLKRLLSFTEEIVRCGRFRSSLDRCRERSRVYLEMWREIAPFVAEWEAEDPPENNGVDFKGEGGRKKNLETLENEQESNDEGGRPVRADKNMADLAQDVKKLLGETEGGDLNREVEIVCGGKSFGVMETVFTDAAAPCRVSPDSLLVKRLKQTFALQRSRNRDFFRVNRGLHCGRIDGRRLHRSVLDGRVFNRKEFSPDDNVWNITILVDASASMKGVAGSVSKSWRIVEKTFVSLYEAAKGSGNNLNVFAYFEGGARCQISRLLYNKKLFTVAPNGRTPTGQAIIVAVLKTPKDKRRLIVHITDGEPNCGADVEQALEFCSREGVDLVTIGCYNYKDEVRDLFRQQYGDGVYLMDSLEHLPAGLESLLRRKLLGGGAEKFFKGADDGEGHSQTVWRFKRADGRL